MIGDVSSGIMPVECPPAANMSRRVLAAVNCMPSDAAAIGNRCGLSRVATTRHLSSLVKRGRIQRVGYGLFTLNGSEPTYPMPAQALARPQPVRDQILAFLTEPRQAFEVAAHTGRRTATITGHMRAMLKLNLVERVGYGRYARTRPSSTPPSVETFVRPHPTCDLILAFLDQPRRAEEIAAQLQRPVTLIRDRLRAMQFRGLVRCIQPQVFTRMCKYEPIPTSPSNAATAV